ncbi:hypothetical protein [Micromonospora cremea]|uniref:Uncharacterized protein n=1 Tax=Micromonospora cremea TaxID=709881 RepID=A0A1N5U415_9ACTN|nr:hypothetical protein [Micromonospora cremea]SIM54749.1 hypothetical protein SAMN04489832_0547 [Micromonospora cremea]
MLHIRKPPLTTSPTPERPEARGARAPAQLALWQLNLLRVGYFVMGVGLAVVKWPLLFADKPWGLMDGTTECLLVAMSILALIGLRYPQRMLPVLLFEVAWKLLWLGIVALPLWLDNQLEGATRKQAAAVLWVGIIIAVIPWRHVLTQYVLAPGEPWRRSR